MPTLYVIRHAQSEANALNVLAGQKDYPLTAQGHDDARHIAERFCERYQPDRIICSPLLRTRQTAQPFADLLHQQVEFDPRIMEQNMGRFSSMSYAEAEADPSYQADRSARWNWIPAGGGESYEMVATRIRAFLSDLLQEQGEVLVVTHSVAMRLLRANIEHTLPLYPSITAANGEIWKIELNSLDRPNPIEPLDFGYMHHHRS